MPRCESTCWRQDNGWCWVVYNMMNQSWNVSIDGKWCNMMNQSWAGVHVGSRFQARLLSIFDCMEHHSLGLRVGAVDLMADRLCRILAQVHLEQIDDFENLVNDRLSKWVGGWTDMASTSPCMHARALYLWNQFPNRFSYATNNSFMCTQQIIDNRLLREPIRASTPAARGRHASSRWQR